MKPVRMIAFIGFVTSLLGASVHAASSECPSIDLPSSFTAKEVFFTLGTDLDLIGPDKKNLGRVEERMLRLTTTFEYFHPDKRKAFHAKKQLFSWGSVVDVYDCKDRKIGTIREEVMKSSFGKAYSSYKILDANGRQLGTSKKLELLATELEVTDTQGNTIATLKRPWLKMFTDSWKVTLRASRAIDPRLLVMIPAFKTSADKTARAEKEKQEKEKEEREKEERERAERERGKHSALDPGFLQDSPLLRTAAKDLDPRAFNGSIAKPAAPLERLARDFTSDSGLAF